jgi:hypothetical protein
MIVCVSSSVSSATHRFDDHRNVLRKFPLQPLLQAPLQFQSTPNMTSHPFLPSLSSSSISSAPISPSIPPPISSVPSAMTPPTHRGIKWIYLGVIATAPSVHIMVSLYRQYPKMRKMFLFGITTATIGAWLTRVGFMYESGFMFDPFPKWE